MLRTAVCPPKDVANAAPGSAVVVGALTLAALLTGCADTANGRAGLAEIPTRTAAAATTLPADTGAAPGVENFTVLPTFTCLEDEPARSIVTVGWSAPAATEVSMSLDGRVLPVGIRTDLPYQVPAGGPTGIGAAVVFDCNQADRHTIDVVWTAGESSESRTVTIAKEQDNG